VAFVWKFKKCLLWHECFRILVFKGEPPDGIEHTRAPPGIQLESVFDKYARIIAVFVVLVIFFRPLDGEFRKPSLRELGLRQFRFRKLGLRQFGFLQFTHWIECVADPEPTARWFASLGQIGLRNREHPRRERTFVCCELACFRTRLERIRPGRLR
jgi:hypothetical protein